MADVLATWTDGAVAGTRGETARTQTRLVDLDHLHPLSLPTRGDAIPTPDAVASRPRLGEIVKPRKRRLARRLERLRSIDELDVLVRDLARSRADPCARCVFALIHVELSERRARRLLERLIDHRERLSRRLGRRVTLRTAAVDSIPPTLRGVGRLVLIPRRRLFAVARWVTEDPLTGLKNRRALGEVLTAEASRAQRFSRPLSVLLLDLDDFKRYNDTHGHLAGDQALKVVGAVLRSAARNSDVVARYGGEEFAVVAPETGTRGGAALAERIRRLVTAASRRARLPEPLTVSIGGATRVAETSVSGKALLASADEALYEAKRAGKDRVAWGRS